MNQSSNIGSMFPGAEFKGLREKAKEVLMMHPTSQIMGIMIKTQNGDTIVIEKDKMQVFHSGITVTTEPLVNPVQIAQVECEYWKKVCDDDPGSYGIEGMCAAGNIIAALVRGLTVEEFRKEKEENNENNP